MPDIQWTFGTYTAEDIILKLFFKSNAWFIRQLAGEILKSDVAWQQHYVRFLQPHKKPQQNCELFPSADATWPQLPTCRSRRWGKSCRGAPRGSHWCSGNLLELQEKPLRCTAGGWLQPPSLAGFSPISSPYPSLFCFFHMQIPPSSFYSLRQDVTNSVSLHHRTDSICCCYIAHFAVPYAFFPGSALSQGKADFTLPAC